MLIFNLCRNISANQRLLNQNPILVHWARTLFSEKILRISTYESHRMRVENFTIDTKKLTFEMRNNNVENVIQCTKQWIHKMDRRQCEMEFKLLQNCLRYIHKNSNNQMAYNFAPTVMRMLHYLNLPEQALQINYDLQLSEMFQQLSCVVILCDMLFNNGMYREVVQTIQRRREELEKKGSNTSRHMNYLLFAACYKLNTSDDLNLALEIWNNCRKEHQLTQSINFLSVLAINQEQPQMALEILPPNDKHFSSMNVRLLALSECGHFAEATEIVQQIVSQQYNKSYRISSEVMANVKENLSKSSSTELLTTIDKLTNEMQQQKRLVKTTLDEILCWPITDSKLQGQSSNNERTREFKTQLK